MAQHLQLKGIRANLSSRGIGIKPANNGKFVIWDMRSRHAPEIRCEDLDDAYHCGIHLAAKREQSYRVAA